MKRLLNIALDNAVALGVVVIVLFLIIPLPTFLLDFLLIVNIGLAIMILIVCPAGNRRPVPIWTLPACGTR